MLQISPPCFEAEAPRRSRHMDLVLNISTVLYVLMKKNDAGIHTFSGRHYKTRAALNELEQALGDSFLKVSRGCLVSVMAIHDVTDVIALINGDLIPIPPGTGMRSPPSCRQSRS